jgi:hypothetical protein
MAIGYADGQHSAAVSPDSGLKDTLDEALKLREALVSDARALITRGLLASSCLKDLKGTAGYKNVASDLQIVAK